MKRPFKLQWYGGWKLSRTNTAPKIQGFHKLIKNAGLQRARIADVLKGLEAAGIPRDQVLVKGPYPPELGPIFDEVFAGKDLGKN